MQSAVIAWANLAVLVISTLLTSYFYIRSASPAALEKKIGLIAYEKCTRYRVATSVFMTLATLNYVIYVLYPLPIPLPRTFPWSWYFSCLVALLMAVPSGYLFWRGLKDAGEETIHVKKEHRLYGGIYDKIRHPQALGELPFWWVLALLLDSPFLAFYSFVWIPIFVTMCLAEERDLTIRYGKPYEGYRKRTGFFIPKRR
jgi:protein-S-isoprenylcysteine O-methyltransferase Ste14